MRILILEDNFYIAGQILTKLVDSFQEGESGDLITVIPTLNESYRVMELLRIQKLPEETPENHYDILLIDHDLPDGNGTWFLKNHKKKFKHIIAISSIPENNKRLMENGAHNAVNKMEKDFLDRLLNILKKRQ